INKAGWQTYVDASGKEKFMATDGNGNYYKPVSDYADPIGWMLCNSKGVAISPQGTEITDDQAHVYTPSEMKNSTGITFRWDYPNPDEVLADGLKKYRLS